MKIKILPSLLALMFVAAATNVNAQGGTLPLNGSVNGNLTSVTPDVWDITTNADGLLRLTFTTVSPADLFVTLYDNNGTTVLGGPVESFNNSTVLLSTDGLAAGSYHVKITPFSTAFGSYTLADSLFTSALAIDAEPNGTSAAAVTLPLNGSNTGHVGYYYNNLRDTTDWYKVTATTDGLLKIYLSSSRSSIYSVNPLDVNLYIYDNDGTTQLGFKEVFNGSGPATDSITVDGLAPGTYYIKVQPFSTNEFANYTISNNLFTPPLANDAEPNGSVASAVILPVNGSMTGHVGYYYNHLRDTTDWYKVTTTTDGLLKIFLASSRGSIYSVNPLDVNVWIYDNDGTTQLGFKEVFNGSGPATDSITVDGLAPGTYYIKVQPFSTNEFANYTISNTLFTPPLANDAEPNGTAATAVVLPLNGSNTGHVGYYYNNLRDTTDWYKLTTTTDGLLKIFLSSSRGSIYSNNPLDVNVYIYDNDGTTQLGFKEIFNGNGPATDSITVDGLAPGTYYIKVQPFSTNEFANYTISNTLFTTPVANDAEPNGTTASAVVLPVNGIMTGHVGYYYNHQRDTTDWYKVTTTTDGLLKIFLTSTRGSIFSVNPLDVNVYIYDNDGTTQLGFKEIFNGNAPATATDSITVDGLAPGTYYIKVQPFSTNEFANYTISDALFIPTIINDMEPNGTPATAQVFPSNSNTKGHVGYYYNNQRDTADWYKITTLADGPLHIYLNMQRGSIYSTNPLDMLLTFYSSDGTTQLGSKEIFNGNGPGTDSLNFALLMAGTYFVKVTNFSTTEFGVYSLSNSGTPIVLPVTFINFDGTLVDNSAILKWSTSSEYNNKGFEVEKSADGHIFTDIGFVQGNGNSSVVNNYNYTDRKILSGNNYYRLKQIDIGGRSNYSSIISLDFKNFAWSIFGNPVTSNSWVQLQLAKTSNVTIKIIAADGRVIKIINKGNIVKGTYSIPLSLGNLSSGLYVVRLMVDKTNFSKTIIK